MDDPPAVILAAIARIPAAGPYLASLAVIIPWIVFMGSGIAFAMPAPFKRTGVYYWVYTIVNLAAISLGHARNLSAPSSTGIVGGPGAIRAPMIATAAVPVAIIKGAAP